MPPLKLGFARRIGVLMIVALALAGCSDAAEDAEQEPTASSDTTQATVEPSTPPVESDSSPTPEPAQPSSDTESTLTEEQLAGMFELEVGEQIEDEQGNLVAIYGVLPWPQAYETLEPFDRADIELFGGIESEWVDAGALAALDIGICAPGVTPQGEGGSAEFFVSAHADAPLPVDRSGSGASNSRHPVVEPGLVFPEAAECSRGWLPVAWEGGESPVIARYLLSVRAPGGSDLDRYLYQWQVTPSVASDVGTFGPGEVVSFHEGDLAGTTITMDGWAEFVGSESSVPGTRIVGVSLEVCPASTRWPQFGVAVDGWNLTAQLVPGDQLGAEAEDVATQTCHDGWLEFAVPLGGVPTGFFAADGADPVAGFASWSFAGAALPPPQ